MSMSKNKVAQVYDNQRKSKITPISVPMRQSKLDQQAIEEQSAANVVKTPKAPLRTNKSGSSKSPQNTPKMTPQVKKVQYQQAAIIEP